MSGVVNVWFYKGGGERLGWWTSGFTKGVVNVWGGEHLGWWMSGWWTSYNPKTCSSKSGRDRVLGTGYESKFLLFNKSPSCQKNKACSELIIYHSAKRNLIMCVGNIDDKTQTGFWTPAARTVQRRDKGKHFQSQVVLDRLYFHACGFSTKKMRHQIDGNCFGFFGLLCR